MQVSQRLHPYHVQQPQDRPQNRQDMQMKGMSSALIKTSEALKSSPFCGQKKLNSSGLNENWAFPLFPCGNEISEVIIPSEFTTVVSGCHSQVTPLCDLLDEVDDRGRKECEKVVDFCVDNVVNRVYDRAEQENESGQDIIHVQQRHTFPRLRPRHSSVRRSNEQEESAFYQVKPSASTIIPQNKSSKSTAVSSEMDVPLLTNTRENQNNPNASGARSLHFPSGALSSLPCRPLSSPAPSMISTTNCSLSPRNQFSPSPSSPFTCNSPKHLLKDTKITEGSKVTSDSGEIDDIQKNTAEVPLVLHGLENTDRVKNCRENMMSPSFHQMYFTPIRPSMKTQQDAHEDAFFTPQEFHGAENRYHTPYSSWVSSPYNNTFVPCTEGRSLSRGMIPFGHQQHQQHPNVFGFSSPSTHIALAPGQFYATENRSGRPFTLLSVRHPTSNNHSMISPPGQHIHGGNKDLYQAKPVQSETLDYEKYTRGGNTTEKEVSDDFFRGSSSLVSPFPRRSPLPPFPTPFRSAKLHQDGFIPSSLKPTTRALASNSPPSPQPQNPSPQPQNLKGDLHRQAKVKTELCLYYARGHECPFGDKCNYAHGEDELKYTKLLDLKRAGLLEDVNTYRTHPCLSWVTTGACPFGQRCNSLHDPRIAGSAKHPSWLPHAEAPMNNLLGIDVNVHKYYHQNLAAPHQTNPLIGREIWEKHRPSSLKKGKNRKNKRVSVVGGPSSSRKDAKEERRDWDDTYTLVCNIDDKYSYGENSLKRRPLSTSQLANNNKDISELHRLCIALYMSYETEYNNGYVSTLAFHRNYVFDPSHIVFNELGMILQTRYFYLCSPSENTLRILLDDGMRSSNYCKEGCASRMIRSFVCEISLDEYNSRRTPWDKRYPYTPREVVIVREIAFGPIGDQSKVSLWFDVPESDCIQLTPQQVKRFKRTRHRLMQQQKQKNEEGQEQQMNRPLASNALAHATPGGVFLAPLHRPFVHAQPAVNDDESLDLIRAILRHRVSVLLSRALDGKPSPEAGDCLASQEFDLRQRFENLKRHMELWAWPVNIGRAKVDEETEVPTCNQMYTVREESRKIATRTIWESFVTYLSGRSLTETPKRSTSYPRLKVFLSLAGGKPPVAYRSALLPHIHREKGIAKVSSASHDSWKWILLNVEEETNPWNILKRHYLNLEKKSKPMPTARERSPVKANRDKNMPLRNSSLPSPSFAATRSESSGSTWTGICPQ